MIIINTNESLRDENESLRPVMPLSIPSAPVDSSLFMP